MKIEIELTEQQIEFLLKNKTDCAMKDASIADTVQAVINAFCDNSLLPAKHFGLAAMDSYNAGYGDGYDDGYLDGKRKGYQDAEDDYIW